MMNAVISDRPEPNSLMVLDQAHRLESLKLVIHIIRGVNEERSLFVKPDQLVEFVLRHNPL